MTRDKELILITKTNTVDELGDKISVDTRTSVLCGIKSVSRSEFYTAAATGLQPEIIFIVNRYDYSGQKDAEYENKKYKVIRTYAAEKSKKFSEFEDLELVCKEVHA